ARAADRGARRRLRPGGRIASRVLASLTDDDDDAPDRAPVAGAVDGADAEDVAAGRERLRVAGRAPVQRRAVECAAEAQRAARREVVDRTELERRPHSAHSWADDA